MQMSQDTLVSFHFHWGKDMCNIIYSDKEHKAWSTSVCSLFVTAYMSTVGRSELNPGDSRLRLPSSSPSSSFSGSMSSAWVIQSK